MHLELPGEAKYRKGLQTDVKYLDPQETARLRKLIREEQRSNVEWWLKLISMILTRLIGLIGASIGLIAMLKK